MKHNRDQPTGRELTDLVYNYVLDSVREYLPSIHDTQDEDTAQRFVRVYFPQPWLEELVLKENGYLPKDAGDQPMDRLKAIYLEFLSRLAAVYPQHAGGYRSVYTLKEPGNN